jgi:hypothetical protein
MYKVFIDNSILYIGTSEEDFSTIFKTPYESISFDELNLLLNTSELEMSSDVYVMISDSLCEDLKSCLKNTRKLEPLVELSNEMMNIYSSSVMVYGIFRKVN